MRQRWRPFVLVLACVSAASAALGQQGQNLTGDPVMLIRGDEDSAKAMTFTRVFEDPSGKLTLDAVRGSAQQWLPARADALTFGFSRSVWWVRLDLQSLSDKRALLSVDLGNPRQDYVHWFVLRNGGAFLEESTTGDRLPFTHRGIPTRSFMLPLTLGPKEHVQLFIRLQSYDGLFEAMPLQISILEKSVQSVAAENQLLALYHGGLVALAIYNLLLFFALREKAFGLYVVYLFCFFMWSFTFRGYSFQYFWPQSPDFNNDVLTVITAFTFATLGLFAISYLRMRELTPRWVWRLNQSLVAVNLLASVPALSGYYALGAGLGQVAGAALALVTLSTAIWLLTKGSRPARFFVIAFAIVGAGAISYIFQIVAVLPTNWLTTWGVQVGSAIEVLLLAFGLADSVNQLKAQKLDAERQAREAQEALNAQLAQQVNERNEMLEMANRRLHELAITDELTGAFNRKHFSAFCGAALAHRDRDEPLAFCIFDIDSFKSYNDRYGLEAGNEALRAVAQSIRRELRRSGDVLFRLGGEEFGILFTANTSEAARLFVERLRGSVHGLSIVHEDAAEGVLTASFGVGWWDKGMSDRLTPNHIYAVADNMLYEAKEAGRNRVKLDVQFGTGAHDASKLAS